MQITIPKVTDRSPEQIINEEVYFDSVGYIYRALSWLDIAKKRFNVCALQYAAHDSRQGIEQLLFEELVMSAGTALDRADYDKCKGNATKLNNIIRRLSPNYEKLAQFTEAIMSSGPETPRIGIWSHQELMKHWGGVSNYLHWAGEPSETVDSKEWLTKGINIVEAAANHIWDKKTRSYTGIMMPHNMQPEIRDLWNRFKAGRVDLEIIKRTTRLALPILSKRMGV